MRNGKCGWTFKKMCNRHQQQHTSNGKKKEMKQESTFNNNNISVHFLSFDFCGVLNDLVMMVFTAGFKNENS